MVGLLPVVRARTLLLTLLLVGTFLLVPPMPGGADAAPAVPAEVYIQPPTEGTRIILDATTSGPVYRFNPYGAFPAGSIRAHEAILLDGWDGTPDETEESFALSVRSGLLFAQGSSGDGSLCFIGCGGSLQKTLFRADHGVDRMTAVPVPLIDDLPETVLWGHTVEAGAQWDLPLRYHHSRIYNGNVTVESLTAETLELTVQSAVRDTDGVVSNTYRAHLRLPVSDGVAGPFASERTMTEEAPFSYPGQKVWSSVVAVVEDGTGAALPFEAQTDEDIWPGTDLTFAHGPNTPMPFDPQPHAFFDVGLTATVALLRPDPSVAAFLSTGALTGVSEATLDLLKDQDVGWPAHHVLYVGIWSLGLCNTAGDQLWITMHGVQPRSGPFVPLTFFTNLGGTCDPDDFAAEHAALGDVIRRVEGLVMDRLWQPDRFHYTSGGRSDISLTYGQPRLAHERLIEVRLEMPMIDHAVMPRESNATRVLP